MERGCGVTLLVACFLVGAVVASALEATPVKEGEKTWVQLFNGRDLTGWKKVGAAAWKVEKGLLVGRQGPGGKPGDLFTVKEFDNFELVVTYKCDWPCNSGVWFRYQKPNLAYQADVLEYKNPEAYSGTVYCPGTKELFIARNLNKKLEKRNDWNTFVIRCQGDQIVVHLNKKKVADVRNKRSDHGRIGFQVHAGDEFAKMAIYVKEIKIRPLKKGAK